MDRNAKFRMQIGPSRYYEREPRLIDHKRDAIMERQDGVVETSLGIVFISLSLSRVFVRDPR